MRRPSGRKPVGVEKAAGIYFPRAQTPGYWRKPNDPLGFIPEYREFLIDAILEDGKDEFYQTKTGGRTAVGEYASIAGGVDTFQGILFADVRDERAIPVLIDCLSAPDDVYAEDQGCNSMGEPGAPTGRNTQRQGIPFALARLQAIDAIPELKQIAETHHDPYLRQNAMFAIDVLVPLAKAKKGQED